MSSPKSTLGRGGRLRLMQTRCGKREEVKLKVLPPDPHFDRLVKQWNEAMAPTETA